MANILVESPRGYDSIRIEDKFLSENREIFLTEEVTPSVCNELIKQFMYLDRTEPGKEIKFYINSPGGSVYDGLSVYDCIMGLESPVKCICMGTCASMGSLLFLSGDIRQMREHGRIMIHDASFSSADFSHLKPDEIREKSESLLKTTLLLRNIIAERTGQDIETVTEKMKTDSYFNAEEALEFGLATSIIKKGA